MKSFTVFVPTAAIQSSKPRPNALTDIIDQHADEAGIDRTQYRCVKVQVRQDGTGYDARYDHKDQQYVPLRADNGEMIH